MFESLNFHLQFSSLISKQLFNCPQNLSTAHTTLFHSLRCPRSLLLNRNCTEQTNNQNNLKWEEFDKDARKVFSEKRVRHVLIEWNFTIQIIPFLAHLYNLIVNERFGILFFALGRFGRCCVVEHLRWKRISISIISSLESRNFLLKCEYFANGETTDDVLRISEEIHLFPCHLNHIILTEKHERSSRIFRHCICVRKLLWVVFCAIFPRFSHEKIFNSFPLFLSSFVVRLLFTLMQLGKKKNCNFSFCFAFAFHKKFKK